MIGRQDVRWFVRIVATVGSIPVLAACGAGGTDAGDTTLASVSTTGPVPTEPPTEGPDCAPTDVDITNHVTGDTATATVAAATTVREGALYNLHVADFDLDTGRLSWSSSIEVPTGAHALRIGLTAFGLEDGQQVEPLTVGAEIVPDFDFSGTTTFLVGLYTADDQYVEASKGTTTGRLLITGIGDAICAEIDYTDVDKSVRGSILAPVID